VKSLKRANGQHASTSNSQPSPVTEVCVARQPIFGTVGDVVGYELLYRRAPTVTSAAGANRNTVAADAVVDTFLAMGLEQLTSGRSAYFDFTREMLLGRGYTLMSPESVVVELLQNVEPDEELETACEELVDAGYSLALDDFAWSSRYRRLVELATVVKVDVLGQPAEYLDELAQRVAPYDVRLLAERVETADVRAMCSGLGYELFQGPFFTRPETTISRALMSDEAAVARTMTIVRDPRTSDADAEAAFASDAGLGYKLLRMVNSAVQGGRGIESIRHALQLVGRVELSKWLALVLVSSLAAHGAANRELVQLAVQRGRMCELLGTSIESGRDGSTLFLVGLFSLLDAISGIPMSKLLDSIALATPVRQALMERTGPYAGPLMLTEAYEQGAWSQVGERASSSGIDAAQVVTCYVQSLAWTRERLLSLALG
jgi:EAL and modified HD-GYP domain-containing signal transduction protein